jgi:hypothetical protein
VTASCRKALKRSGNVNVAETPLSAAPTSAVSCAVAEENISRSPLLAPLQPGLPSLANNCFIVGEGHRADVVWSRADFLALCDHMLNGNSMQHFLTAWADAQTGQARFAKANRSRADKRASWAWDTITEKAKTKTSIGFYPSNKTNMTRWAAIDFDAHNGEHEHARKWSLEAFSLLLKHPQLYLVLCASGNGYHLFIFARELYPVGEWIVLLKQTCDWIGAPIADGVCEIFPNEKAEAQPVGKGIRAPGTFNPKTGTCSLIEADTTKPLLDSLPRSWSGGVGKVNRSFLRNGQEVSLHKSTNTYSLSTEPLIEAVIRKHPILRRGSRNSVLMELIGDLVHKFGFQKAREIVQRHYQIYKSNIGTPFQDHYAEFENAWGGQTEKIRDRFTATEKAAFDHLSTDHQREAFRIVWAFAGAAAYEGKQEFPIVRDSLADRLSVTQAGASSVVQALVRAGAIRVTRAYRPHVSSTLYEWMRV